MATEFKFPDVGEGITEGTIVSWKVKEGDAVHNDQVLAEVETDKAVVEIPSPVEGHILKLNHKEGDVIEVGEVLAVIGAEGEEAPAPKAEGGEEKYTGSVVGFLEEADGVEERPDKKKKAGAEPGKKSIASPRARMLAKKNNVDLESVTGTGPGGRITEDDVKKAMGGSAPAAASPAPAKKVEVHGDVERVPMKGIRKITAQKMAEAAHTAAMVTHHDDVDLTALAELRDSEKEKAKSEGVHLTYLAYVIKAVIAALKNHPHVASSIEGDEIIIKKYYNIGVAIDTPDGLVVPVIKEADKKSLYEVANAISDLVKKAKDRKLGLDDFKGGVFTITNIGVIGTTYFTPIVNYPESCIIGTGKLQDKPVVVDGQVVVRKIMPLSFTYDHRVLDGAEAARFLNEIIDLLHFPGKIQ